MSRAGKLKCLALQEHFGVSVAFYEYYYDIITRNEYYKQLLQA